MSYTEKILNHANKINELHNIASEAVRKGVLSSFTVNDREHSDMIGKGLYLGLNMTYHAIELEINNIKSMMENGDKKMKEFELKAGDKVFIREDLKVDHSYGSLKFSEAHRIGFLEIDYITKSGNFHLVDGYIKMIYSKEMIDWDKTKELQSKENEMEELTVEMIKELLDKGIEVELECIDNGGYLRDSDRFSYDYKCEILKLDSIKLLIESNGSLRVLNTNILFPSGDIKYFRIKEQEIVIEKEPSATFDELIDIAVQAYKDGVLPDMELDESGLSSSQVMCCISAYKENIEKAINNIHALYTETFIVKSFEDYQRINATAVISCGNAGELIWSEMIDRINRFKCDSSRSGITPDDEYMYDIISWAIDGSTVTQKKGGK